ncbi:MAG TPA: bifunctional serine/threonine-protein kinase/formylglycine-generating enzyme family protein, partial [Pyrinomonadaceae bacterium]
MKECPACHRCFADQLNHCPSDGDRLKFLINLDTTLDERYQLERKLGQGGMGLVFKAQHKFIKTQHAIKVILPDLVGNDPSLAARFRQEAMAAAAIRHPNTVSVTDYGVLGGTTPYLVMEFVEGRSLHDVLAEERRLAPEAAVEIMLAVCAGVAAAHRQGIVHRDLKPLNIMLRPGVPPGETLKVLDFGLAKIKSGELLGSFVAAQTQGMMGSPFYMAPEQWGDDDIDVRADIYSLGVILYQMVAGDVPFKGKSVPSIMSMHLNSPPVPLAERGVEVPPPLERAIQHALEKSPEKRPHSVEEFAAELREALPQFGGGAALREPGATTVQIGPSDTTGLKGGRGHTTGTQAESLDSLKTIAAAPDAHRTGAHGAGPDVPDVDTVAESHAAQPADAARGSDTASHGAAQQTIGHFGAGGDGASTQHVSQEALTEPLPASADALRELEERRRGEEGERREREERERRQAEEQERREIEERRRREALERERLEAEQRRRQQEAETQRRREAEQQERHRLEAEERQRVEVEERQRLEAEERRRREAEGRERRELEERRRREAEERAARDKHAAASPAAGGLGAAAGGMQPHALSSTGASASGFVTPGAAASGATPPGVAAPARSRTPLIAVGVVVLLALLGVVGVVGYLMLRGSGTDNTNAAGNANAAAGANTTANVNAAGGVGNENGGGTSSRADLLWIPGGTFQMGRSDVPPITDELKARRAAYLLWTYNQWPAHEVSVGPFAIDRTEVTNAEYADFVKETGHQPPPGVWEGGRPSPGVARLPVSNVTYGDAVAFAAWRSKRDGVTYRLPTEQEWEYAARGGDSARAYPWGSEWSAGYANLGGAGAAPVGSYPLGRTPQGLDD